MIIVYRSDIKQVRRENKLDDLLRELPANMHEKALRYKFEKDAYNYVSGRLLLKRGLQELGKEAQLGHIMIQENGKPMLEGIYFNISHTHDLVVCALSSDGEIGVDVEMQKPVKLENFKHSFTEKEWAQIINSADPLGKFYCYWTRKESIIKAMGITLSYMNRVELDATRDYIVDKGKTWYLIDLDLPPGFFGALCSEAEIRDLQMM